MVDIEADGPIPGDYSMVCFGAVVVEPSLKKTFYGRCCPVTANWLAGALEVSGFTRDETIMFPEPAATMEEFATWLKDNSTGNPRFISDNNGFDWQFINWYFHHFLGRNPFGYSSTNLGSLYRGLVKTDAKNFKHLRKTKHTHNPLDDALGNAEAFLRIHQELGFQAKLI